MVSKGIPDINDLLEHSCTKRSIEIHYPILYNIICEKIPGDLKWTEKLYWFYHDLRDYPKCPVCGDPVKFISLRSGYRKYCSSKCCNSDPEKLKKQQETTLKHYGVVNPSQSELVKQKVSNTFLEHSKSENFRENIKNKKQKTCLEKYGVAHSSQNSAIKSKIHNTCMTKYGSITPLGNKLIQEKSKQTKLERYGDEYYTNPEQITSTMLEKYGVTRFVNAEKIRQTKFERYGDGSYNNNKQIGQTKFERYGDTGYNNSEKIGQTKLEKYGVAGYNNQEQIQKTCLERYGTSSPMQNEDIKVKSIEIKQKNKIENVEELIGYTEGGDWICKCPHPECKLCQSKTYITRRGIHYDRKRLNIEQCTTLLKEHMSNSGTSIELFIQTILDKHNIQYITGDRAILNGKELDFYIPGKNAAIECNGIFFHSTRIKIDHKYHYKKWKDCFDKNIQLISIWEDQIKNKPNIVESIILSKLGIYNQYIYARKCIIKEISPTIADEFLCVNHLQGSMKASIRIGLYYKDELVSVMTFCKKRGMMGNTSQTNSYELSRFCNKLNTQIIGGASKLFKYFLKTVSCECVYSFSSNDISAGQLYKTLGFDLDRSNVSYWYIDGSTFERHHRSEFSKASIVQKHIKEKIDNSWTESSVTYELGLYQIYDSGQQKWIYTKKEEL
jgi:hypothetical protein